MKRREFLKSGAALAAGGAALAGLPLSGATARAQAPAGLPAVRLGTLEVSRLILGSNPFWGYSHKSAALDEEMRRHHTDERIMQILDEAASCGVTAVASPPDERWRKLWTRYAAGGGRLGIWISQCHGNPEQMLSEIDRSVEAGAKAVFIQGARVEEQFGKGRFDTLRTWIEHIRKAGCRRARPPTGPRSTRSSSGGASRRISTTSACTTPPSRATTAPPSARRPRRRSPGSGSRSSPTRSWRPEGSRRPKGSSTPSTTSGARTASASASTPRTPSTRSARTPLTRKCSRRTEPRCARP